MAQAEIIKAVTENVQLNMSRAEADFLYVWIRDRVLEYNGHRASYKYKASGPVTRALAEALGYTGDL